MNNNKQKGKEKIHVSNVNSTSINEIGRVCNNQQEQSDSHDGRLQSKRSLRSSNSIDISKRPTRSVVRCPLAEISQSNITYICI